MYLDFFGLNEKPFSLTPDPRFLYLSESHRQALDHLIYGVQEHEGFILIVGDIGTGKTTICRELLEKLDKRVASALILNPMLSEQELLEAIVQDFDIRLEVTGQEDETAQQSRKVFESLDSETQSALELNPMMPGERVLENILGKMEPERPAQLSKKGLIDQLNAHLLKLAEKGGNAVLIIDEAQNLSPQVLEQIRILSNLETTKQKLLQIVLVGQLELKRMLEQPELRQLNQRISIRYRLKPLTYEETKRYMEHRLFVAGSNSSVTFTDHACRNIYDYSKGVPRLINLICERCLLAAYVDQVRKVDSDMVLRCRDSLEGNLEDLQAAEKDAAGALRRSAGGQSGLLQLSEQDEGEYAAEPPPEEAMGQLWERGKESFLSRLSGSRGKSLRILLLTIAALAAAGILFIIFRTGTGGTGQRQAQQAGTEQSASMPRAVSPAVRLAFSIQLGAFQNLDDGLEQMRLFSEQGLKEQLYIVPLHIVQLGGRWYRLFYGGFPSKASARSELTRLAGRGTIKAGSARVVETSLAFNLGDFTDRRVAEEKRSQYMSRWQIPAYVFQLETRDETPVYRLYAGAFEQQEQSSFLADRIDEAGLSQMLVERLGCWPLK